MTWNGSTAPCHAAEEPRVAPKQPPSGGDPPAIAASHANNHRASGKEGSRN
jgi:hypothetical protein